METLWYEIGVRYDWDGDQSNLRFHYDDLILSEVIYPLLIQDKADIEYWRFHRAAGTSGSGPYWHMTIDIKTTEVVIKEIYKGLELNEIIIHMKNNGIITDLIPNAIAGVPNRGKDYLVKYNEAYTPWPDEILENWHVFINGICEHYLRSVIYIKNRYCEYDYNEDINDLIKTYEEINSRLNGIWKCNGQHIYLHHINSIFSYKPLLFEPRQILLGNLLTL